MRISFWPDRAWASVVGAAWPWIVGSDGSLQADRIASTLIEYWTKRIARVPSTLLSERTRTRIQQARPSITADTVGGAGYERVVQATHGDVDAFWFLDLGAAAWVVLLNRLRREGWIADETANPTLDAIERVWRHYGPGHATQAIDAVIRKGGTVPPALYLYRVPLALWHEKSPKVAMTSLDRAVARLTPEAISAMGSTLPLTYGLLHALSGDSERAALILSEGRVSGRPGGWAGLTSLEVRYHRARYLWDLRRYDEAIDIIRKVIEADASYLLRMVTDAAWAEGAQGASGQMLAAIGEIIRTARNALTRWQQSRRPGEEGLVEAQRIAELLDFAGDEPYMILAASTLLSAVDAWRAAQAAVGHVFFADLDRIRNFASALPDTLPLRLGYSFRPRFVGDDSDMEHLESLVESGSMVEASEYVGVLLQTLPIAIRMAAISYGGRLVSALATAIEILAARGRAEDEPRLDKLTQLSARCLTLIEPIKTLPEDVGPALTQQLIRVWDEVMDVEKEWVRSDHRAFGQLRLMVPPKEYRVRRGDWRAFAVKVVDSSGAPVAGVPVVWRVASGPALPKESTECLYNEWALSLQTGVAYLPVEVKGTGSGGVVEARILGESNTMQIGYRVYDAVEFEGESRSA